MKRPGSLNVRGFAGLLSLTACCVLAVGLAGCGGGDTSAAGPTGTVSGTVTYQGDAVTKGKVQFHSTETGKGGVAELDASGKFTLPEPLPTGAYKVLVLPPAEPPPTSPTPVPMTEHPNIPEKYRTELTTDLTADVKEGENTFPPFDMK